MDPDYPEHYLERLREANAAIIEFEHLIASREEELRAAREEIAELRDRLANTHVQELLDRGPASPANSSQVRAGNFEDMRNSLEDIIAVAADLRAEVESLLPSGILERLDGLIQTARTACEKLS